MKVLFLTNVPSPYRVDFFNELGKLCDLTVLFEKRTSDERDDSWKDFSFRNFKGIFLKGVSIGVDTAVCPGVIKHLKKDGYDFIIVANFSSPTGVIAVDYLQRHKIKYLIETDGGSPKNGKGFKERLKRKIIKGAFGCLGTGKENDRYFIAYGATEDKIFRYPFTSLYDNDLFGKPADDEELSRLREELNIKEKRVILSVGRFSYLNGYGKGYDVLLKAAKRLPSDIGWYVIGGQPTEEFNTLLEKSGLENFHFVDFKLKDQLKKYYRASDLFVLMTVGEAWGLVINEAMACGLPVVTTDKCIAGTELITDAGNGFIVPVGDVDSLTNKVAQIIDDRDLMLKMGNRSIEVISGYTFEKMAIRHVDIFNKLLSGENE